VSGALFLRYGSHFVMIMADPVQKSMRVLLNGVAARLFVLAGVYKKDMRLGTVKCDFVPRPACGIISTGMGWFSAL